MVPLNRKDLWQGDKGLTREQSRRQTTKRPNEADYQ